MSCEPGWGSCCQPLPGAVCCREKKLLAALSHIDSCGAKFCGPLDRTCKCCTLLHNGVSEAGPRTQFPFREHLGHTEVWLGTRGSEVWGRIAGAQPFSRVPPGRFAVERKCSFVVSAPKRRQPYGPT